MDKIMEIEKKKILLVDDEQAILDDVRKKLGGEGATKRAAELVVEMVG